MKPWPESARYFTFCVQLQTFSGDSGNTGCGANGLVNNGRSHVSCWKNCAFHAATVVLMLLTASGCARMTDFAATDVAAATACQAFAPIAWSRLDTPQTIISVRHHNADWLALCTK